MRKIFYYRSGFTLIEILVVITIAVILATIITSGFSSFRDNNDLDIASQKVIDIILEARTKTLSSQNDSQYSVYLDSLANIVKMFPGNTCAGTPDTSYSVPSAVSFNATISGGGDCIIFERLTGETDTNGTITLEQVSDPSKTKIITIEASGLPSLP